MKYRIIIFYKHYFEDFFNQQTSRVKRKILWTLGVIEDLEKIPTRYFKHIENTEGLYEIRVQQGYDVIRIFCFFDEQRMIILGHGFQKKTQKTPYKEIEKALKHKRQYYEEKKFNHS